MEYAKTVSLCVALICVICACFFRIQKKLNDSTDSYKCPFCCGVSLCDIFKEDQISLDTTFYLRNLLTSLFSHKSVLFARWNNKSVVLKPLGGFNQLNKLHLLIKEQKLVSQFVDVDRVNRSIYNIFLKSSTDLPQNIKICPNADHINILIDSFLAEENAFSTKENVTVQLHKYINIWMLFQINAEPFIQKLLKGAAVSTFLGCCGNVIVSENCGEMLTNYAPNADWNTRVNISHQLLRAALQFTLENEKFAFYFTDISADNIAVSEAGTIKLVDVEDVIIVDKNPKEMPSNWDATHVSQVYEPGVFSFSPDEICSHRISDHNVYAVCQEILGRTSPLISGGLLFSPPPTKETKLNMLLEQCIESDDRFKAANELLHFLRMETKG